MTSTDALLRPAEIAEKFAAAMIHPDPTPPESQHAFKADAQVHEYISAQTNRYVYRADGLAKGECHKISISVTDNGKGVQVAVRDLKSVNKRFATVLLYRLTTDDVVSDYVEIAKREMAVRA